MSATAESLDEQTRHAWQEYLSEVRQQRDSVSYEEAESWAWARLQGRLRAIARRRSKIAA